MPNFVAAAVWLFVLDALFTTQRSPQPQRPLRLEVAQLTRGRSPWRARRSWIVAAAAGYWWLNRPPGPYTPDNSGLCPINVEGKYGFIDRSGKMVITPQFDEAYTFSEGLAAVRVVTKFGYIDTRGAL